MIGAVGGATGAGAGAAAAAVGMLYERPATIRFGFCCSVGLAAMMASQLALLALPRVLSAIFARLSPGSALYCLPLLESWSVLLFCWPTGTSCSPMRSATSAIEPGTLGSLMPAFWPARVSGRLVGPCAICVLDVS